MQPSAANAVTAREAAALLGVKPQTLYAYASRGLLRRVGDGKRRRYLLEDLERLQARQRARSGHGPVAAGALSFGEPVLDTRLTSIDERGPLYRGHAALQLAQSGYGFEAVAELLWTGELAAAPAVWQPVRRVGKLGRVVTLEDLLFALPSLSRAPREAAPHTPHSELAVARSLIVSLAELAAGTRAQAGSCVAQILSAGARAPAKAATSALQLALVLVADHELNASSFAARVAASTGAKLLPCLSAALSTLSGPRHGGACDRVEALLEEATTLTNPALVIERRVRRGDVVPGFGHALYPRGDPRAHALLEVAQALSKTRAGAPRRIEPAHALARAMARQGLPPTVDFGLVTLTRALGMRPGSAALLFAVGRSAGWVAHVLEQRESTAILRPRARYRGP